MSTRTCCTSTRHPPVGSVEYIRRQPTHVTPALAFPRRFLGPAEYLVDGATKIAQSQSVGERAKLHGTLLSGVVTYRDDCAKRRQVLLLSNPDSSSRRCNVDLAAEILMQLVPVPQLN